MYQSVLKRIRPTESFRQIFALVSLARIFETVNFFLIHPVYNILTVRKLSFCVSRTVVIGEKLLPAAFLP